MCIYVFTNNNTHKTVLKKKTFAAEIENGDL